MICWFFKASLQRKQMLVIMLTTTVALLLACGAFVAYEVLTFRKELREQLSTLADVIGNTATGALEFNDCKVAEELLSSLRVEGNILSACIYDREGRVFGIYQRINSGEKFVPPPWQSQSHEFSAHELRLFQDIRSKGERVGTIYLQSNLNGLAQRLQRYAGIAAAVLAASLLAAFLLSSRLQRLISGPILHLAQTARVVAQEKNYSVRALKHCEDEIGYLIDGFNEMLGQIQQRESELQEARDNLEKRVEERTQELEKSLSVLNATLESTADGILVVDREGQLVNYNEKFLSMWKLSPTDMALEKEVRLPVLMERLREPEAFRAKLEDLFVNPDSESYDLLELNDGRIVERFSQPQRLNGASVGRVFSCRDITERKQAEDALTKAKDAAEAANRAKSQFLANMSHEIRTPMNGILGMTGLALETHLTAEQRGLLTTVKESGETLLSIINDVLDFSKIEAGKMELSPISFELRHRLEDSVAALGLRAHEKGLELASYIEANVPDHLVGDPQRLRQVLVNLLGNAIKFTDTGEVVLRVSAEERTETETVLHFSVTDTGIGIPEDKQQMIFKPFTQADNSTTRVYGGTGLGLTISRQLVELMGGRIWLESKVGLGTTFHFTARFGLDPAAVLKPEEQLSSLKGLRTLIVDDNATNRFILEKTLAGWGMHASSVANSQEAMTAIYKAIQARKPFQLLLLDAMMPRVDGFTLAERLRHMPDLSGTVLMMLSSAGQVDNAERCRRLGVSCYLTKPVRQSELLDAIMSAIGTHPRPSSFKPPTPPRQKNSRAGRILLAEDHPVNQRLALRLLEKWGHSVVVAPNGRKALEALENDAFDLVLMDVQMPEMGGCEATEHIREKEKGSGKHIPIVAMTAHALKGDREQCLAAGMDDYISKPIDPDKLFAALEKYLQVEKDPTHSPQSASLNLNLNPNPALAPNLMPPNSIEAHDTEKILNADEIWKRVGDDRELLRELAGLFRSDTPALLGAVRESLVGNNAHNLERSAHRLKGAVSNWSALRAVELTAKLEQIGRAGSCQDAQNIFDELEKEIGRVNLALKALSQKEAA